MDEELIWRYRRWQEADQAGHDEDADVSCRAVLGAVMPQPRVPPDFAARTAAAVAHTRAQELVSARRLRRATVSGALGLTVASVYIGGPWALSMLAALLAGAIDLFVTLSVRMATGTETGGDMWTLVGGLGRAGAALVTSPSVTVAILAMQGIAMAALLALHRLLGPERESLK
jgi:hypothetical protein